MRKGLVPLSLEDLKNGLREACRTVEAARARGGFGQEVRLLAATKYVDVAQMALVRDAGLRLVGENRAEDLVQKWERYHDDLEFHFIGHLQRRKARLVVPRVTLIHSVESLSLVRELHSRALGPIDVLLEVNVSGEESKYGILPGDAEAFMKESAPYDSVRFTGLMTMAPIVRDPEDARPVFQRLRELRDQLAPRFAPCHPMTELSMGMSNDYAVAVEEGATIVRLGSTLFARAQGG